MSVSSSGVVDDDTILYLNPLIHRLVDSDDAAGVGNLCLKICAVARYQLA